VDEAAVAASEGPGMDDAAGELQADSSNETAVRQMSRRCRVAIRSEPYRYLALERTCRQPGHDLPFGKQVEEDCRQGGYSYKCRRQR